MEKTLRKGRVGSNLTEGPILKSLLLFAIPIVLTNLIQQLYSMVDLIVIGQFVGKAGSIGVNTGGEIADFITPVAMAFSTAGQIYIAQLFGAGEDAKIKKSVGTLLTFTLLLSIVLGAATIALTNPVLRLLNCPETGFAQARSYMIITALGFPFIFGYNAVCGVLRGMGESKKPLIFIIVAAVVNIFFDILLVAVFKLEAAGTAIATVFSQIGSFAAAFYFMWKARDKFDFELKLSYFKMDRQILWIIVKLGIPQAVRSMLVRFSMMWCNSMANSFGDIESTTNGIGNKLQKFLEVFIQGVDTAAAAMIGQNLGAKKPERAKQVVWCTLYSTVLFACVISVICAIWPEFVFGLFITDAEVASFGAMYLRIMIVHFFSSATVGSFQAMVTGSGFVSLGFAIGLLDGVICKVGLSLLFLYVFHMGFFGLVWGVACSRSLPAVLCAGYFFSGKWRTRKLLTEK